MQTFLDLIKQRRSIRAYEARPIAREDLELCVEAARYAPSTCNAQPWKFIAVDDANTKTAISKHVFSGFYNMNSFAKEAAAFVAVVSERTKFPAWLAGKFRSTDFRHIDIGIACAHIVLQAQELGIGTCVLGWFNEKKFKKILSVHPLKKIELVIALGYPKDAQLHEKALKDKKETVSFNKY